MHPILKKWAPHSAALFLFAMMALAFFYPVLQGKKIYQNDIVQYIGMAKERNDFRKGYEEESYWTNSAFGGMPTYQLGSQYPHDYLKKIDVFIRFLPRPADYLFLYFIGCYIFLLVLKVNWRLAILGAIAFGFSTYLLIILGVGHNSKAHAIGYFPFVLAGVLLVFQHRYLWGFLLTAVAMALELYANHFQMTYYLLFLVLIIGIAQLVDTYQKKELPHFFKSVGLLSVSVLLAIAVNATALLATSEYTRWSTRGASELTINPDGSPKTSTSALSKEYITEYSYGIAESLNLFVPRLFGGANSERLGENSNTYRLLINEGVPPGQATNFVEQLPTYWGGQPIVAAPAYIGAVVLFLWVLALFLVKGNIKWWLIGGTAVSLILSWGKHVGWLTDALIEYVPLYDKFRAVSSIQVILELCIPVLAVLGVARLMQPENRKPALKALKISAYTVGGVVATLFILRGFFDFEGVNDAYYRQLFTQMGLPQLMDSIVLDRKALYTQDLLRSLVFVLLTILLLGLFLKARLKSDYLIAALAVLMMLDLGGVARRYVNKSNFVNSRLMEKPFEPTAADTEILKDTSYYRVFEPALGLSGSRTAYFHHAIGGYHAAKSKRFQELYDFQLAKNNTEVLNMLNVKYVIQTDESGTSRAYQNPDANGSAWFVTTVIVKENADAEIQALDSLHTKREAVVAKNALAGVSLPATFTADSTAFIQLASYQPNRLVYKTANRHEGLAIFSEMHYPKGWQATIDGKPAAHFRANYVLRAMLVPAGTHTVTFTFQPEVIRQGSRISLAGSVLLGLLAVIGIGHEIRNRKQTFRKTH